MNDSSGVRVAVKDFIKLFLLQTALSEVFLTLSSLEKLKLRGSLTRSSTFPASFMRLRLPDLQDVIE